MSDGTLRFNTKIDNTNVDKDLKDLERKIRKAEEDITKNENEKIPVQKSVEKLGRELGNAGEKADLLKGKLEELKKSQAFSEGVLKNFNATPEDYDPQYAVDTQTYMDIYSGKEALDAKVAEAQKEYDKAKKAVDEILKKWKAAAEKVVQYNSKIEIANESIESYRARAAELTGQTGKMSARMQAGFQKAGEAASNFSKRLINIAKSALIFSLLYRVLQKAAQYMGKLLQTNEEYRNQMAQLRAALMTAFQPIYEFILPGLIAVLRVLTSIVMAVANVLSYLTGRTAKDSAEAAKNLNDEADACGKVDKAAQKASKSLANFDKINTLSTESGGSSGDAGGGPTANFEEFSTAEYKAKIDELTVYVSGALLALGAILAFSGANIPLGIALMAVGALGLVTVLKENWGKLSDEVKTRITKVMGIVGGALLALGAILAFSGVSIGLGIGLMVAGAAGLATAATLNWNSIVTALQGPFGKIVAMVSGALLVIGLILAFSGVLPLGIALIAAGAAGLVTVTALNWNAIIEALKGPTGELIAMISGMLLVLGIILCFAGMLPLGIALIAAGAAGLVTVSALNWSAILDELKGAWGAIKNWFNSNVAPKLTLAYWQNKFSWLKTFFGWIKKTIIDPLKTAFKEVWDAFSGYFSGKITFDELASSIGNTLKNLINKMIEAVNKLLSSICGKINQMIMKLKLFKILGIHPFRDMQTINPIPQIPKLAKGAVLPPNRPFMAMVGDQKNGTNVEAPLDTIKQALAEVMAMYGGNGDTVIRFEGDLAQLGRVLKPVIDRENSRVGASLATGGR